ncbi:MAG TPA: GNAT family N-acetyltransferase [Thermoanaerobaculia bacterium]|nr:GNAT family N-acetyltransferase [Thermoanaerobaculia bacterium]
MGSSSFVVRRAGAADRDLMLDWRNDPAAVALSETGRAISAKDHERWFAAYLAGAPPLRRIIFIGEKECEPVGSIRFDCPVDAPGAATISIVVAPNRRGEGIGAALLEEGMRRFEECAAPGIVLWNRTYVARVREANTASRRIFERCGFLSQQEEKS